MEKIIYVGSAYLAPVEYYTKLFAYDKVYVERYDNYVKQTYRNRCVIAAAKCAAMAFPNTPVPPVITTT